MTRLWARKSTDCMGYVSGLHSKIICRTFKTKLLQPHLRLSKSESLGGGPRLGKLLILLRSFQETAEFEKQVLFEWSCHEWKRTEKNTSVTVIWGKYVCVMCWVGMQNVFLTDSHGQKSWKNLALQFSESNDSKNITLLIKSHHGQVSLVQSFEWESEDASDSHALEI